MSRESIEEAIEVLEDASAETLMETGDKNYVRRSHCRFTPSTCQC